MSSDPASWKCDKCRELRLEEKRQCGFIPGSKKENQKIVWLRGNVSSSECPRSYITPQSVYYLEKFFQWKIFGNLIPESLTAKEGDALMILNEQLKAEQDATNQYSE